MYSSHVKQIIKYFKIKDFKEVTAALLPDILPQQLSLEEYFESYKITPAVIASLNANATIIASKNDPVVPIVTFADLENNEKLNLIITDYGGHNGFIENYKFSNFVDFYLVELYFYKNQIIYF